MQRDDSGGFDDGLKDITFLPHEEERSGDRLRSVILNFDALQHLYDWSLKNCTNLELNECVLGVNVHTNKFAYIFGIHLAETILAHTCNLNKTLPHLRSNAWRQGWLSTKA